MLQYNKMDTDNNKLKPGALDTEVQKIFKGRLKSINKSLVLRETKEDYCTNNCVPWCM